MERIRSGLLGFQFLIGTIQTYSSNPLPFHLERVSIPHRYDTNVLGANVEVLRV